MPTRFVQLDLAPPYDRWAAQAARDMQRVRRALGPACAAVHHVGSTSVPGLHAVPVLDLVAEVTSGTLTASLHLRLMVHGYAAAAPEPPCQVFIVEDPVTRRPQVELRCYPAGHEEVQALVAIFAYLRAAPDAAAAYAAMKQDARAWHGAGTPGYHDAKAAWMRQHAAAARRSRAG